jgi:hypothetical protein
VFNCEEDSESERICSLVGLQHYPSVLYVGHGSYYPNNVISFFDTSTIPEKTILYKGELYFESVRDWCRTMHFMSKLSRFTQSIKNIFGWNKSSSSSSQQQQQERQKKFVNSDDVNGMKVENEKLRLENAKLLKAEKMMKESMSAYSNVARDYGTGLDVFEVLSSDSYGVKNSTHTTSSVVYGLRQCMVEVLRGGASTHFTI